MYNVLIIAQRLPFPPNKGEKLRTYYQIEHLVNNGFSVTLVCPQEQDNDKENAVKLSKKLKVTVNLVNIGNRKFKLVAGLFGGKSLSVANFYSSKMQKIIDDLLKKVKFDCLLCTASSVAEYVFKNQKPESQTVKPKLFMDFMDLDSDKWNQYARRAKWPMSWVYHRESRLLTQYENMIHDVFDGCFFVAQQEVDLFAKQLISANKSIAIGNGIDLSEFQPLAGAEKPNELNFLFTGVMDYPPNIDAVVWFVEQVWPAVINRHPDAQFYIAGMNPTSKVNELTKTKGVVVTGFVDDIMPYFNNAHIFVAPFRIARGVQNKVLQAFACALPVVATSMGAEGIDCINNEHLLIADDAANFQQAIFNLIDDSGMAQRLGDNACNLIHSEYTWESKLAPLNALLLETKSY